MGEGGGDDKSGFGLPARDHHAVPQPYADRRGDLLQSKSRPGCVDALFRGVADLSLRGYNIELDFHFAKVAIKNRDLQVHFLRSFVGGVQMNVERWPERAENASISKTWQKKDLSHAMMNFSARPNSPLVSKARTHLAARYRVARHDVAQSDSEI